jgi:hypothetical protein
MDTNTTAMLISTAALVFTILSFWWMNWRKDKLIIAPPRLYAAVGEEKGKLIFQIPLVFYNNGAATQVVQNLKLEIEQNNKSAILIFNGTESDLAYQEGSKRLWARQFAIEGRKTYSAVFEF